MSTTPGQPADQISSSTTSDATPLGGSALDLFQEAIAGLTDIVRSADEDRGRDPSQAKNRWGTINDTLAKRWIEQLRGVAAHLPTTEVAVFTKDVDKLRFRVSMVIKGADFPESWSKGDRPIVPGVATPIQSAAQCPDLWIAQTRQSLDQLTRIGSLLLRSPAPDPPTIWSHGSNAYSIDGIDPVVVTEEENCILQAFLEKKTALGTRDLESASGVNNVSRVVNKLMKKHDGVFARAGRVPGKTKGAGYFFRVCMAPGS